MAVGTTVFHMLQGLEPISKNTKKTQTDRVELKTKSDVKTHRVGLTAKQTLQKKGLVSLKP